MNRTAMAVCGVLGLAIIAIAALLFCVRPSSGPLGVTAAERAAGDSVPPTVKQPKNEELREPAVAGAFYPEDKTALTEMISGFLAKVPDQPLDNLRALVCPHAGYMYSGQTAAFAYKQLLGRSFRTVFILGPSHYADFEGAYIAPVGGYKTPLGVVPLADEAAQLAEVRPFVSKPRFEIQAPRWGRGKAGEKVGRPDEFEHSLEVQVPFLQRVLKDFAIVPIMFGRVQPAEVAKALRDRIDDKTLIVASSDLSHFYTDDVARQLDDACIKAIVNLDVASLAKQEACGKAPILALVEIAKAKGWKAKLLDTRTSGAVTWFKLSDDSLVSLRAAGVPDPVLSKLNALKNQKFETALQLSQELTKLLDKNELERFQRDVVNHAVTSDKSNVVGYAAIAFFGGSAAAGEEKAKKAQYNAAERKWMLDMARRTMTEVVNARPAPDAAEKDVPAKLREQGACFVTLTIAGELRGCIGHIIAVEPLYKSVMNNARHAALEDYRFNPVRPDELKKIHMEISVLTKPEPLAFDGPDDLLKKLQPQKDGLVLRVGGRSATFLPQVWEKLPDKVEFLSHLSQKAGMPASAWRERGTQVSIYHVEAFEEEK
ncbi:MAG: AmmeMemoRadiSam system protein B [Planctomycetota bacterium]|nr:AmmeMemoRadiSam system protein B [Planctomycetota bacterium]